MEKPKSDPVLKVDDTFASYQDLQEAVDRYESANRVQFWKRDAKRLHRATPRIYEIVKHHPQLEYCNIRFTCIHGGQTFRSRNAAGFRHRKSRGTWKQNCKAEILVSLNEDKDRLVVRKIVDEHNHEIPSEEVYRQFPKSRRNAERQKFLTRPSPPCVVQNKQEILDNLVRANSLARSNNLKRIANILAEKYHCVVDLQSDEQDKIVGFFFQDPQMRTYFDYFPEILLMDGTYKLQNIGCCVYVLSAENSLGTSDVVGICALTLEDKDSIEWMLDIFKKRNPKWENTNIIVTDRLTSEYQIVPNHFPNAKKLICLSHALQTFKKDTAASRMSSVTQTESEQGADFFLKLMDAKSEEEYHAILEDMEDNIPYILVQYFFQSWHHLRNEWVKGLAPFRNCVNSKFESPNSKLKATVANCKTFSRFIENVFLVVYLRRNELKCDFSRMITKVPIYDDAVLQKYAKYLTSYATEKIQPHLALIEDEMTFDCPNEDSDVICEVKGNTFVVSEISCNCDFFTVMKLPCRHLLTYRKVQGLDLFYEYLFSNRWTRKYVQSMFSEFGVGETDQEKSQVLPTEKTVEEKFEEAQAVCLALAGLCSEVPADRFEERMAVLAKLREFWQVGDEVVDGKGGARDEVKVDHDYVGNEEGGSMDVDEAGE